MRISAATLQPPCISAARVTPATVLLQCASPPLPLILAFALARRPEPPPQPGATAKMLAETGLCLSLDAHQEAPGGVLTPWTGLGPLLASRLRRADGGAFMKLGVRGV